MSYDDQEVLREFSEKQSIPYPLLSDVDSEVIRRYGILNDQVKPGDLILYGIPYPGVYMTDAEGVVVAKSFHGSYKIRDSPEVLIDATLGRVELDDTPTESSAPSDEAPEVSVRVALRGGRGTIRQGIVRQLVARFDVAEGFHLYGEPVPDGMLPTKVEIEGPEGLVVHDPIVPETQPHRLESLDVELPVWSGTFDIVVPFHAAGALASEVRAIEDGESARLTVKVAYQACDDEVCLLPRTETFEFDVPLEVVDIPKIGLHDGHGQRAGNYDGTPHLRRLLKRKFRESPLGFVRHFALAARLNFASWLRRRRRD